MLGSLDSFNSANYRKFILDEEIIKHVQAYIKPAKDMNIDKTVDLITEVGQHGTYVKHKNTLRNYRKEHSFPDFGVRSTYEEYVIENKDITPVSYTHLDVYKRQVVLHIVFPPLV